MDFSTNVSHFLEDTIEANTIRKVHVSIARPFEIPRGRELGVRARHSASHRGKLEGLHGLAAVARDTIWSPPIPVTLPLPLCTKHAFLDRSAPRIPRLFRDLNRNERPTEYSSDLILLFQPRYEARRLARCVSKDSKTRKEEERGKRRRGCGVAVVETGR